MSRVSAPVPYIPPGPSLPDFSYIKSTVDTSLADSIYSQISGLGEASAQLQRNIADTNALRYGINLETTALWNQASGVQGQISGVQQQIAGVYGEQGQVRQLIAEKDMKIYDRNKTFGELQGVLSGLEDTVPELDMRLESLLAESGVSASPEKPVLNSKIRRGVMNIAGLQSLGGDESTLGGLS
jgi:hypothetical protein